MDYEELIDKYKIEEPFDEWFLEEGVFRGDLKYDGWKLTNPKKLSEIHHEFNDSKLVITNPNFYEDGWVLAESRRSRIIASGLQTEFTWDDKVYTSFYTLFKDYGPHILGWFSALTWSETKDWFIVDKKSNKLLGQFDYWDDAPTRKEVEQ